MKEREWVFQVEEKEAHQAERRAISFDELHKKLKFIVEKQESRLIS